MELELGFIEDIKKHERAKIAAGIQQQQQQQQQQ